MFSLRIFCFALVCLFLVLHPGLTSADLTEFARDFDRSEDDENGFYKDQSQSFSYTAWKQDPQTMLVQWPVLPQEIGPIGSYCAYGDLWKALIWQPSGTGDDGYIRWNFLVPRNFNAPKRNKLEFWLRVSEFAPGTPDDHETLEVILVSDTDGGSLDGYIAQVKLDFSAYFRKVTIYFGKTHIDIPSENYSESFYTIPGSNPVGYHHINALIIRNRAGGDNSKIKVRISKIRASSDSWLWNYPIDQDSLDLDMIPQDIKDEVNADEWGLAYKLFQDWIYTDEWVANPFSDKPGDGYHGRKFRPEQHGQVYTPPYNYRNYHFETNKGWKLFRDDEGADRENIDWLRILDEVDDSANGYLNRHKHILYTAENYYIDPVNNYIDRQRSREFLIEWIEDANKPYDDWPDGSIYGPSIQTHNDEWFAGGRLYSVWNGICTGIRALNWLAILEYEKKRSNLPDPPIPIVNRELFVAMMKSLYNHGKWLNEVSGSGDLRLYHNKEAWGASALYIIGDRFPWFRKASTFREATWETTTNKQYTHGDQVFRGLIHYDLDGDKIDGADIELGSNYFLVTLMGFNNIFWNQHPVGYLHDYFVIQRSNARTYLKSIIKPGTTYIPAVQDGGYQVDLSHSTFTQTIDVSDVYILPGSRFFEISQYCVLNNNGPDDMYLFMDGGPYGSSGHQHQDKLNIIVSAAYEDWLIDSGGYGVFDPQGVNIDFRESQLHNTIEVYHGAAWHGQNRNRDDHAFVEECVTVAPFLKRLEKDVFRACVYYHYDTPTKRLHLQRKAEFYKLETPQRFKITDTFNVQEQSKGSSWNDFYINFQIAPQVYDIEFFEFPEHTFTINLYGNCNRPFIMRITTNSGFSGYGDDRLEVEESPLWYFEGNALDWKTKIRYFIRSEESLFDVYTELKLGTLRIDGSDQIDTLSGKLKHYQNLGADHRSTLDRVAKAIQNALVSFADNDHSPATLTNVINLLNVVHTLDHNNDTEKEELESIIHELSVCIERNFFKHNSDRKISTVDVTRQILETITLDFVSGLDGKNKLLSQLDLVESTYERTDFPRITSTIKNLIESTSVLVTDPALQQTLLRLHRQMLQRVERHMTLFDLITPIVTDALAPGLNTLEESYFKTVTNKRYVLDLLSDLEHASINRDYGTCRAVVDELESLLSELDLPAENSKWQSQLEMIDNLLCKIYPQSTE